jgi:hypothetical protein
VSKPLKEYSYLKRIKIQMMIITIILSCFILVAILDGGKYEIAAGIALIVLYFSFTIWQDSNNKILIFPNGMVQYKGAGPFLKVKEIKWHEAVYLKDKTGLFTFGRAFYVQDNREKPQRIEFDSTLKDYQDLLLTIVKRSPNLQVDPRALQMMSKVGIDPKIIKKK